MKITEEIIKELDELAIWDGCETGGYCHILLELRESYSPTYCSIEFAEALDTELIGLYNCLKEFKADEVSEDYLTARFDSIIDIKKDANFAENIKAASNKTDSNQSPVAVSNADLQRGLIKNSTKKE